MLFTWSLPKAAPLSPRRAQTKPTANDRIANRTPAAAPLARLRSRAFLSRQLESSRDAVLSKAFHSRGKRHSDASLREQLQGTRFRRSEERRVGKECRCRWWPHPETKKEERTGDARDCVVGE